MQVKYVSLPEYLSSLPKVPKKDPSLAYKSRVFPLIKRVNQLLSAPNTKFLAGLFTAIKDKQAIICF